MSEAMPPAFPTSYTAGYMQQAWVQEALGVPLDFTATSTPVSNNYLFTTGDACRFEGMKGLEYLLDQGIKVVLVYGDRDFECNCKPRTSLSPPCIMVDYMIREHHYPFRPRRRTSIETEQA